MAALDSVSFSTFLFRFRGFYCWLQDGNLAFSNYQTQIELCTQESTTWPCYFYSLHHVGQLALPKLRRDSMLYTPFSCVFFGCVSRYISVNKHIYALFYETKLTPHIYEIRYIPVMNSYSTTGSSS